MSTDHDDRQKGRRRRLVLPGGGDQRRSGMQPRLGVDHSSRSASSGIDLSANAAGWERLQTFLRAASRAPK